MSEHLVSHGDPDADLEVGRTAEEGCTSSQRLGGTEPDEDVGVAADSSEQAEYVECCESESVGGDPTTVTPAKRLPSRRI